AGPRVEDREQHHASPPADQRRSILRGIPGAASMVFALAHEPPIIGRPLTYPACAMSLTPSRLAELHKKYSSDLLESTIPFWLRHGLDREHGGLLTGLAEDGAVIDTDKAVWLQGRAAWTFATLYNTVEQRPEWLAASKHCLDFIRAHCRGPGGKLYFTVTRDGRPLRMRRYVYSECFAAIGSAACAT